MKNTELNEDTKEAPEFKFGTELPLVNQFKPSIRISQFEYGEMMAVERQFLLDVVTGGNVSETYKALMSVRTSVADRFEAKQRALKLTLEQEELDSDGELSLLNLTNRLQEIHLTENQIDSVTRAGLRTRSLRQNFGNPEHNVHPTCI